jgi:hypothetical protein
VKWWAKEEETVPTRKALEILRSAEEGMKTAEGKLRDFIERSDRQYSPGEGREPKYKVGDHYQRSFCVDSRECNPKKIIQ